MDLNFINKVLLKSAFSIYHEGGHKKGRMG